MINKSASNLKKTKNVGMNNFTPFSAQSLEIQKNSYSCVTYYHYLFGGGGGPQHLLWSKLSLILPVQPPFSTSN